MKKDNEILYFPAIRTAFQEATSKLDDLMAEAHKKGEEEVAQAYRTAFTLVREGIQRAERQGESTLHKHLEKELEDISIPIYHKVSEVETLIGEKWDQSIDMFKASVLKLLKSKNVSEEYLNSINTEIDEYVHFHVEEIFGNKGYNP